MNTRRIASSGSFTAERRVSLPARFGLVLGFALLLTVACTAASARAQGPPGLGQLPQGQMGNQSPLAPGQPFPDQENAAANTVMEEHRLRALNADRQKSMVSDTNKLVKLAAELNAQVDSARGGKLTPSQERMVAEIEKLAHNIREKMSTPIKGPAPVIAPPRPIIPGLP